MQNVVAPRMLSALWSLTLLMAVALTAGCARSPGVPTGTTGADDVVSGHRLAVDAMLSDEADYDPWQPFNERMFCVQPPRARPLADQAGGARAGRRSPRGRAPELRAAVRQPRDAAPAGEQPPPGAAARRGARAGALRRQHHGRASAGSSTSRSALHVEPSEADAGADARAVRRRPRPLPRAAHLAAADGARRHRPRHRRRARSRRLLPALLRQPGQVDRHRRQRALAQPHSSSPTSRRASSTSTAPPATAISSAGAAVVRSRRASRERGMGTGRSQLARGARRQPRPHRPHVERTRHEDLPASPSPSPSPAARSCAPSRRRSCCATCAASTTAARSSAASRSRFAEGEIFGLLGPNGAGKTTLLSMISTRIRPTSGDAWVYGKHVVHDVNAARRLLNVAPQEEALYPSLTAAREPRLLRRALRRAARGARPARGGGARGRRPRPAARTTACRPTRAACGGASTSAARW